MGSPGPYPHERKVGFLPIELPSWVRYICLRNHKDNMKTTDSSQVNEWNEYPTFGRFPSDYGNRAGDLTNGMTAQQPRVSNRNEQGQMQDRAARLLMEKTEGNGRRIRG